MTRIESGAPTRSPEARLRAALALLETAQGFIGGEPSTLEQSEWFAAVDALAKECEGGK